MAANDHDLLTQIEGQVTRLRVDFDQVSNGVGYRRCVERLGMIEKVAEKVAAIESRIQWQDRLVIGTIILLAIKFVWQLMPLPSPI